MFHVNGAAKLYCTQKSMKILNGFSAEQQENMKTCFSVRYGVIIIYLVFQRSTKVDIELVNR